MVNICVNMCEWAYTKLGNGLNQAKKRAKTSQMETQNDPNLWPIPNCAATQNEPQQVKRRPKTSKTTKNEQKGDLKRPQKNQNNAKQTIKRPKMSHNEPKSPKTSQKDTFNVPKQAKRTKKDPKPPENKPKRAKKGPIMSQNET